MRGVYHQTCHPGVYGGMWRDQQWAATGGYPPFLIEDQAALLKNYHWQDGLRRAVMCCRACEVVLFDDRAGLAEFRAEHAEHDVDATP
jgi:hypothetical protein